MTPSTLRVGGGVQESLAFVPLAGLSGRDNFDVERKRKVGMRLNLRTRVVPARSVAVGPPETGQVPLTVSGMTVGRKIDGDYPEFLI